MTIEFYKFEGSGNDFIIIDNRKVTKNISNAQIRKMCDRKFGIGADGLMFYNDSVDFDFEMVYYNSNGYEGSMCGNGGRCMIAFSRYLGNTNKNYSFNAVDGKHKGIILDKISNNQWSIKLKMADISHCKQIKGFYEIDTGSPHYIEFVEKVDAMDVFNKGKNIRYSQAYAENGINVNFAEQKQNSLFVRTYERGVENETLSCGTGVTASAVAFALKEKLKEGIVNIQTLGGNLEVSFTKKDSVFKDIWLKGPVTFVFKGEINI
jgi:diaminopimelate epimerase